MRPPPAIPAQPAAKRLRRVDLSDVPKPSKSTTPLTPSLSDEEAPSVCARSSPQLPVAAVGEVGDAPLEEDGESDAALARRLHASLNCTPARTSRARGPGPAAAAHCAVHINDPGLLPSC
jgi:hypothetical protein